VTQPLLTTRELHAPVEMFTVARVLLSWSKYSAGTPAMAGSDLRNIGRLNLDHQFETIDMTQLEHVAGGGKIARKIKNALKKLFEGKAVSTSVNFDTGETTVTFE
jgi:hypothetical protein